MLLRYLVELPPSTVWETRASTECLVVNRRCYGFRELNERQTVGGKSKTLGRSTVIVGDLNVYRGDEQVLGPLTDPTSPWLRCPFDLQPDQGTYTLCSRYHIRMSVASWQTTGHGERNSFGEPNTHTHRHICWNFPLCSAHWTKQPVQIFKVIAVFQ